MYQYTIEKVTRLANTDTVTAVLDLGFSIKTKVTFKLDRIEVPELDFTADKDPEVAIRSFIVRWFKTAPKPLYVQMRKEGKEYVGEILDKNGRNLANDLEARESDTEQTAVISYVPNATTDPASI